MKARKKSLVNFRKPIERWDYLDIDLLSLNLNSQAQSEKEKR